MTRKNNDTVRSTSSFRVAVSRDFDKPAEQIFDAWLDRENVGRWWFATPEGKMTRVEIDPRVGGDFVIAEQRGDELAEHFGEYVEIERPRRLVFSFRMDKKEAPSRVTVEIASSGERCRLDLSHSMDTKRAQYEDQVRSGWNTALESLDRVLSTTEELVITRIFDAPRELVWNAWTDPEHLMRWWGPKIFTCPVAKIDFRVGGRILSCMRSESGPEIWRKGIWGIGVYKEIVPLEKIVCTDSFADEHGNVVPASYYGMEGEFPLEMLITVTFEKLEGNRTRMTLKHRGLPAGEHMAGAIQGWSESFDKLAEILKQAAAQEFPDERE